LVVTMIDLSVLFLTSYGEASFKPLAQIGRLPARAKVLHKLDLTGLFLSVVCAEMRGCATHLACLILLLLLNDLSMN
jgi:hypothetical protein